MKRLLLSYACCLSLAASAATIDSPEVGQFFKLPDWAPAAVDSEHTPGSPETVVDVYTNVVKTTEWKFGAIRWAPPNSYNMIELVPTNAVQPTYVDGRGWDLSASLSSLARAVPPSEGSDWYSAPGGTVIEAGEGAGSLAVSVRYDFSRLVDGSWLPVHTTFTWTLTAAKQETEPVNTGRKAVRAIRLVPEMFSSLYATFEAFYERAYYSCCGEHNVWKTSIYGPTTANHLFRFDLPDPDYRTNTAFWCEFQYHSFTNCTSDWWSDASTNRTVLTRRLIDAENILRLFLALHGSGWDSQLPQIFVERPGWQDLTEYQSYSTPHYLIWSSTLFDEMSDDDGPLSVDFPALDWVSNPFATGSPIKWLRVFTGWRDLHYAQEPRNFDWALTYYRQPIPRMMFERVNFGEPPFDAASGWEWYDGPLPPEIYSPLTNVTEDVLAHPYGDCSLITNGISTTRRLKLDKLGQINQALAGLDRTYYVQTEFPKLFGTRGGAIKRRRYESEVYEVELSGEFVSDDTLLYIDVSGGAEVNVPPPEFVSSTNMAWTSNFTSDYAVAYSDPTRSSVDIDNSITEVYDQVGWIPYEYWRFSEFSLGSFIAAAIQYGRPGLYTFRGDFSVHHTDPFDLRSPLVFGLDTYVVYADGGIMPTVSGYGWHAPQAIRCRASADYEREYEYAETSYAIVTNGFPMSQPGDFTRTAECKLTSLLSSASVLGRDGAPIFSSSPWMLRWTPDYDLHTNYWASGYKTFSDSYSDAEEYRSLLRQRAESAVAKCAERARGSLGVAWNRPDGLIPMRDGDVARWLGHLKTDVKVGAAADDNGFSIEWLLIREDPASGLEFESAGYFDGAGNMVEVPVPDPDTFTVSGPAIGLYLDIGAEAQYETIDVTEYYGFLSNGKQSGCARVDWNWNCLRLNKDE